MGDNSDAFPLNHLESIDSDGDGIGDGSDKFPLDSNRYIEDEPNYSMLFSIFVMILVLFYIIRKYILIRFLILNIIRFISESHSSHSKDP